MSDHLPGPRFGFSLRLVLIVPYVTLVLLLATILGFLSYRTGSDAVLLVSDHLLEETALRISQAVDRHVVGSVATLKAAFPEQMPAHEDIESNRANLVTRFWIATTLHTDPNNYVYYGNVSGQALGLYRYDAETAELRVKFNPDEHRKFYTLRGLNGTQVLDHVEEKLFDPRLRPWFKAAASSTKDIWTSVYIDFGTHDLVATRARRVLDSQGSFQGVIATDMPLRSLNVFVSALDISPNGIAFIIEPNGDLVASSCSPNVKILADGQTTRLNAGESENPMLVAVYDQVSRRLKEPGTEGSGGNETFYFYTSQGEKIHVAYADFQDQAGLHWINIVALPDKDFMGGISQNVHQTVLLAVLATLFVVVIGLSILGWVTGDLRKLSVAVSKVGSGDLERPLNVRRSDEIGELAKSFLAMRQRLQTDHLTGLPNRYAFEQALTSAITSIEDAGPDTAQKFGLLFIDVNDFKRINDQYGHEIGDKALIELALRLRTHVRKEDMVARFAGDEFVVLLKKIDTRDDLSFIREKIEAALSEPLQLGNGAIPLYGGAIGAAYYPEHGVTAKELINIADSSMYAHKDELKRRRKNGPQGRTW